MSKPTPLELANPILMPLAIIQMICVILFLTSPVIWVWYGLNAFSKYALSFLILGLVFTGVYKFVEKVVQNFIDKRFKNENNE